MAVYRPKMRREGEIWDKALESGIERLDEGERGRSILIKIPGSESEVQIFREKVLIFCPNLIEKERAETWFEEQFGVPLGEAVDIWQIGARSTVYYTSVKEIRGVLKEITCPPDIPCKEFADFVTLILGTFCEGKEIRVEDAARLAKVPPERAEKFLEFMTELGFTHIKPPIYRPVKVYRVGCPPQKEIEMRMEAVESQAAYGWAGFLSSVLERLRPALPPNPPVPKFIHETAEHFRKMLGLPPIWFEGKTEE
jgi:hypothetical protein